MIYEYPDYYQTFRCIGGRCPDTCCAGWEVDIDEETFYYYRTVSGPFGERLNHHMKEEGEDKYFPMTEENRCPFLNDRNLCDIILNLGEESLCQVCTEYPRYFMDVGNYEQIDLSLSCMELGRIFFETEGPIRYIRTEDDAVRETLTAEQDRRLRQILMYRDEMIRRIQGEDPEDYEPSGEEEQKAIGDYTDSMQETVLFQRLCQADTGFFEIAQESDRSLLQVMGELEILDEKWTVLIGEISSQLPEILRQMPACDSSCQGQMEHWLEKLAVYFTFRYVIDCWFQTTEEEVLRLIYRSLRMIHLMSVHRWMHQDRQFQVSDMVDLAHLYSKQVEHSDENVERVKRL